LLFSSFSVRIVPDVLSRVNGGNMLPTYEGLNRAAPQELALS